MCSSHTQRYSARKQNEMTDELVELKSSFSIQEMQLKSLRKSLSKATKANNAMKVELQALRVKFNKRKSTTDELYEVLTTSGNIQGRTPSKFMASPKIYILLRKMWSSSWVSC